MSLTKVALSATLVMPRLDVVEPSVETMLGGEVRRCCSAEKNVSSGESGKYSGTDVALKNVVVHD